MKLKEYHRQAKGKWIKVLTFMASSHTQYGLIQFCTSPFCGGHCEVGTDFSPDNERDQGLVHFTLLPSQKEVGCEEHNRDGVLCRGWECAMLAVVMCSLQRAWGAKRGSAADGKGSTSPAGRILHRLPAWPGHQHRETTNRQHFRDPGDSGVPSSVSSHSCPA